MKLTPCTEKISSYAFNDALRCGAKTRNGTLCKSPAIRYKSRCRMHGGKGSGAPKGNQNALRHGFTTKQSKLERALIKESIKKINRLIREINKKT